MSKYWARRLSSQGCVLESCRSKERASNADITYTNRINYNSLRWIKHSVIFNQHSHTPEKANKHALVIDRKVHSVWENLITAYTYSVYTPLQRQNSRVQKNKRMKPVTISTKLMRTHLFISHRRYSKRQLSLPAIYNDAQTGYNL